MAILKRKAEGVRWGRVSETDRRLQIGSPLFQAFPRRLKLLMAWRRSHMFGGHPPVRRFARKEQVPFSSDMGLRKMKALIVKKEG